MCRKLIFDNKPQRITSSQKSEPIREQIGLKIGFNSYSNLTITSLSLFIIAQFISGLKQQRAKLINIYK